MSDDKTGGPAYPAKQQQMFQDLDGTIHGSVNENSGMTWLDKCAVQIAAHGYGALARSTAESLLQMVRTPDSIPSTPKQMAKEILEGADEDLERIPRQAYDLAEAMLAEKRKREGGE